MPARPGHKLGGVNRALLSRDAPLKVGGLYEFEGPVTGSPETATKAGIQSYLTRATGIGLEVIDWGRVSGSVWKVQVRVRSLPSSAKAQPDLEPQAQAFAVPVAVWVVGVIAAALVGTYMVFKFSDTALKIFELVPPEQRGPVLQQQATASAAVAITTIALVIGALWLWSKSQGGKRG